MDSIIWPVECCDVDMPVPLPLLVVMCSIESLVAGQIRVMIVQIHRKRIVDSLESLPYCQAIQRHDCRRRTSDLSLPRSGLGLGSTADVHCNIAVQQTIVHGVQAELYQ